MITPDQDTLPSADDSCVYCWQASVSASCCWGCTKGEGTTVSPRKTSIMRMVKAVVVIFVICQLPYHIIEIVSRSDFLFKYFRMTGIVFIVLFGLKVNIKDFALFDISLQKEGRLLF